MPSWLWSPTSADIETLVRESLKQIGRTSAIMPTKEAAWTVYCTMSCGMSGAEQWLDNNVRTWLFVSALLGVDNAIHTLCSHISTVTEDGMTSFLARNPNRYPDLVTRVSAGEWPAIHEQTLKSWSDHAWSFHKDSAEEDADDGWSGTAVLGCSPEAVSTIDTQIESELWNDDIIPGKVVIKGFRASTAIEKELCLKYENIIGKKLPLRTPQITPREFRASFLRKFPWARAVADAVAQHLTLSEIAISGGKYDLPALPHMLLVGPSGAGKSAMVEEICSLLGIPHTTASVGGTADDCGMSGTGQKWTTRSPSIPVKLMAYEHCANPALIIDEIDKSAGSDSRNGTVQGSLLSMMQPPDTGYMDVCLNMPVDLSMVSFIATANSTSLMDAALLSRFKIITVGRPKPTTDNFWSLLDGIALKSAARLNLQETMRLPDSAILDVYKSWIKAGCDIRELERAYTEVFAKLLTMMADFSLPDGPEAVLH
ncbi:hypothetical protein AA14337_3260 [Acetobacter malorum DSM 14337]|uniref:AAA+ ATPase domain-containing protein n=2 Tax=Acetobacter malorum TaxID=178901 RepID=A0ABQ0Q0J7_9PROT|nr:hypothetical protein AA14337_3260 [Acetobacter malorum DSM 14337]